MTTLVQAVAFKKDLYSLSEMKQWLKKHGLKHYTHRETQNFIRWRQFKPIPGKYSMKRVGKGILKVLVRPPNA